MLAVLFVHAAGARSQGQGALGTAPEHGDRASAHRLRDVQAVEGRDPAAFLPNGIARTMLFKQNKEYVRRVLKNQIDLTADGSQFVPVSQLPSDHRYHKYQLVANSAGVPTEQVIAEARAKLPEEYRYESEGPNPVPGLLPERSGGAPRPPTPTAGQWPPNSRAHSRTATTRDYRAGILSVAKFGAGRPASAGRRARQIAPGKSQTRSSRPIVPRIGLLRSGSGSAKLWQRISAGEPPVRCRLSFLRTVTSSCGSARACRRSPSPSRRRTPIRRSS